MQFLVHVILSHVMYVKSELFMTKFFKAQHTHTRAINPGGIVVV